ncbi:hypothetical protein CHLNCDRAFT_136198 [Chlorella variabilis]|uniref:Uncharacterized protein n=1 Tax=Chlorella variabilis TaxID=554065 RepID=E1ZJZ7_CHLVA|nr:hypothetical protein CHLNCDRAFT_136198 [Chlorella variabilis]EFN54080.1 hypothetical protein CHLNCDRAFT_136198 [Chlorella variabilis]|eukprot:XP_005846182.1 hypothetical protein CHLNCDRAFT_136198 [Chlorella variabilis]
MRPTCAHAADVGFSGRTHAFTVHLPAWQPAGRRRGRRLHRAAARAEAAEPSGEAAAGLRQPQAAARAAAQPALAQPQPQRDPYTLAGQRLRSLLNGVGDGEEEMLNNLLEEQPASSKLALCLLAGGLISAGAAVVCWLCGLDPAGGASLSADSLRAAAVGGAAAAPLVALKALLWSEAARREMPFLEDIHKAQVVDAFKPMLSNLNGAQTAALLASEVVPGVLILLPATTGGITKSLQMYCDMAGSQAPDFLPGILALLITASIAGVGKIAETSVTLEEYEVVRNALENADRYYRLTAMDRDSTPADAQRAADAFKNVAFTWIARNQVAVRFAAGLGALEVIYLGVLWQQTGDLAAPMVAALGAAAVDFAHIRRHVPAKAG